MDSFGDILVVLVFIIAGLVQMFSGLWGKKNDQPETQEDSAEWDDLMEALGREPDGTAPPVIVEPKQSVPPPVPPSNIAYQEDAYRDRLSEIEERIKKIRSQDIPVAPQSYEDSLSHSPHPTIQKLRKSKDALKSAILFKEILDKPLALR